jgi:hypothetical protein
MCTDEKWHRAIPTVVGYGQAPYRAKDRHDAAHHRARCLSDGHHDDVVWSHTMESLPTDRDPVVIEADGSCNGRFWITCFDRCIVRGDEK